MDNANSKEYLEKIRSAVIENLRKTTFAPSVQMTDVPRDSMAMNDEDEAALDDLDEDEDPDKRMTQRRFDKRVEKSGELSDSEDEMMAEANGVRKQPAARKRRAMLNYRNIMDPIDSGLDSGLGTPQAGSSLPDEDLNMDEAPADMTEDKETPSPAQIEDGSGDISGQSPQVAANEDIMMEDSDVGPAGPSTTVAEDMAVRREVTPPESLHEEAAAPVATAVPTAPDASEIAIVKQEIAADDAASSAQNMGMRERQEQDAAGQAKVEQVKRAEE